MSAKKAALPAPLVPDDVDLAGFSSFLLNVERLLASELVALATPEEGWAAMMLRCRSFQQKPPGSLPDDDRILAAYSKAGPHWPEVKQMALRGFVKCSDGRLYHRTMAEVVKEAWSSRIEHRETLEQKAERQKRWRERQRDLSISLRQLGVTPPKGASLAMLEELLKDAKETPPLDEERRNVDVYRDVSVDGGEMPKKGKRREGEEKNPFRVDNNREPLPERGADSRPSHAHEAGDPKLTIEIQDDKRPFSDPDDGDRPVPKSTNPRKPAKATRLAADWKPDGTDRTFADNEGFPAAEVDRIGDGFRDYWIAKSGQDATKVDWHAAWRTWIRRERKNNSNAGELTRNPMVAAGAKYFGGSKPLPRDPALQAREEILAERQGRAPRPTRGPASALVGIDAYFDATEAGK